MKNVMKSVLVVGITLASTFASAAALCPPDSCNVHNGCMDGCATYTATGVAACNQDDSAAAESEAKNNGVNYAYKTCSHGFFLRSKWSVYKVENVDQCQVRAQATFSCFQ